MKPKTMILLAVLLAGVATALPRASAGQTPIPSAQPRRKIVFKGDMAGLISTLAAESNANIGLETDPLKPQPEVKLDLSNVTLDDILNGIVEAEPHYQWRKQDGFIDIYPKEGSCPLLDTMVDYFQVDNNYWAAASAALTSLPEVDSQMKALRLNRHDLPRRELPGRSAGTDGTLFSLKLQNVTLRRALHEITKQSHQNFWVFQRYENDGRKFSITTSAF